MVATTRDHINLLQTFVSTPTTSSPEAAAHAALQITRSASQSTAPKPAISLAQATLAALAKAPCPSALPHLLTICESDPFAALDVFVLSSSSWKAVVAASLSVPLELALAARVVRCAVASAAGMLRRCLDGIDVPEVSRCVKIAKFYCLNAARCSRAFVKSVTDCAPKPLGDLLACVLQLLALTSFVLLFDNHAMLPVHDDILQDIVPLVVSTLKSVLSLATPASPEKHSRFFSYALMAVDGSLRGESFLPREVLRVLAALHLLRSAVGVDETAESAAVAKMCQPSFSKVLLPSLFHCFDSAYEELLTFREHDSGCLFVDTVTTAAAECIASFEFSTAGSAVQEESALEFLLEQVSSANPLRYHVAAEGILKMATERPEEGWRDALVSTILACTRTALAVGSTQASVRWLPIATELCAHYVHERKTLKEVLSASRMHEEDAHFRPRENEESELSDPVVLRLIAPLCEFVSLSAYEKNQGHDTHRREARDSILQQVLGVLCIDPAKLTAYAKDAALASSNASAEGSIPLLPYVLDEKSTYGAILSILRRQGSTAIMTSKALNTIHPAAVPATAMKNLCELASAAIKRHGAGICPAIVWFISQAASGIGENVSHADWQALSRLLEVCLSVTQNLDGTDAPTAEMLAAVVLHHAATVLATVGSIRRDVRQTHVTLPPSILPEVETTLERIQSWRGGALGIQEMDEERALIQRERQISERRGGPTGHTNEAAVAGFREARDALIAAAGRLFDESGSLRSIREEVAGEVALLQASIAYVGRCLFDSGE